LMIFFFRCRERSQRCSWFTGHEKAAAVGVTVICRLRISAGVA
jgi:hypothetical protein